MPNKPLSLWERAILLLKSRIYRNLSKNNAPYGAFLVHSQSYAAMNLTPEPRMNNYRAADIDVLKGLDPVRRPTGHVPLTPPAPITSRKKSSTTALTKRSPDTPPPSALPCTPTARSRCVTMGAACRSISTRKKASAALSSSSPACTRAANSAAKLQLLRGLHGVGVSIVDTAGRVDRFKRKYGKK